MTVRRAMAVAAAALLSLTVVGSTALAGGLSAPGIGGGWSGVSTADPAAVHWNPARLAGIPGFRLQLEAALVIGHVEYRRERRATYQREDGFDFDLPLDPADVDPSKTGWAEGVSGTVVAPSGAIFASYQILDGLTVGLGAYPAFAAALKLPDQGAHRWHLQEAFILGEYVTPAVGWQPVEWLQIGVGVDLVIGYLALRKVDDLAETELLAETLARPPINQANDFGPDAPAGVRELDVLARPTVINGTGFGISFKAGVTFIPLPELTLSLVYQHGVDLVLKGTGWLDMDHDFFTKDLAFQGLQYPGLVKGDAYTELPLPGTLRLGIGWQMLEGVGLSLQASWTRWSTVEELAVTLDSDDLAQPDLGIGPVARVALPRDWNDTFEIEVLGDFRIGESLRLGARLGYHSPASPDSTVDLASIDGHRLIVGLAAGYELAEDLSLTTQLLLQQVLPRRVVASSHDRGNGEYLLSIVALGLGLDVTF